LSEEGVLEPGSQPRALYLAARRLSRENREWSFVLFAHRAIALGEVQVERLNGLDLCYEPLSTWDEVVTVLNLRRALLDADIPPEMTMEVTVGMEVFDSIFRASAGRLPLPSSGEPFRGRHSVAVEAVSDRAELVFPNSWGSSWGDDGTGYLPRAYFERHVDSVWVSRPAWVGWSPAVDAELKRLGWLRGRPQRPTLSDITDAWVTPNLEQVKQTEIAGAEHSVHRRAAFSTREDAPALDLLELQREDGTVVGRAHVLHPRSGATSILEELFVHPDERRQGYGLSLHDVAVELAIQRGRSWFELLLHEADDTPAGRSAAVSFGSSLGYSWAATTSKRPNVSCTGTRRIG